MDSVGSENCVETATEQEYSHVQAVESFTPRKKLKQPDMSRTRWLGGGGSGGAAAGSLSLSLFSGLRVPGILKACCIYVSEILDLITRPSEQEY